MWIDESREVPEVNPGTIDRVRVNVMCDQFVEVDKLYGPLIFAKVRVRACAKTCEWIFERQTIDTLEWIEVGRAAGQLDSEFAEADAATPSR